MIEVKNLKKVYKTKKGVTVKALDGVTLKFPETGMVFILGKSGSGKSTLLNVVGGLDSIDSGEIIVKGKSCRDFKQSHYDSYRNTYIGFIFQEYNILEELTVGANIALAIELQGRKAQNKEINEILKEVDLEGLGARKPNELSGGQKQRVAIARALVKKPEIIMADEPTGALDSVTGRQVFDTLKRLSKDKLVLIVSHDREFSEQYADRIIELSDGKIISDVELACEDEACLCESADNEEVNATCALTEEENSEHKEDGAAHIDNAPEREEAPALSYGDDGITVRGDYQLTEEDRIAINAYLKAHREGVKISISELRISEVEQPQEESELAPKKLIYTDRKFVPTDESKIVTKTGKFKLIKSKLSLKNAFKIGSGALKHKKFRLVFTIFLSLVAFTLFGLADTVAAYNFESTTTKSLVDSRVGYASFVKAIKSKELFSGGWNEYNTRLTPENIEQIEKETGIDLTGVWSNRYSDISFNSNIGDVEEADKSKTNLYISAFSGLYPITPKFVEDNGFTLVGDYPQPGADEIVISEYVFEYFKLAGYREYDPDKIDKPLDIEIKTENDLIGKTLHFKSNSLVDGNGDRDFKIVGILDTGFDLTRYESLGEENTNIGNVLANLILEMEFSQEKTYSFAALGYVDESFMNELINAEANSPDYITDGSINLIYGPEHTDEWGTWRDSLYFQSIQLLSNCRDEIIWLNGEKASLADDEIILSERDALMLLPNDYNGMIYNEKVLKGFEKELYDIGMCSSIYHAFENSQWCAMAKYAKDNDGSARELLKSMGISPEEDPTSFMVQFANTALSYYEIGTQISIPQITELYLNDLAERYGIGSLVVSGDVINNIFYAQSTDGSYNTFTNISNTVRLLPALRDQLPQLAARKFAIENYSEASRYNYFLTHNSEPMYDEVINNFVSYLLSPESNQNDGFVLNTQKSFDRYRLEHSVKLFNALSAKIEAQPQLEVWSYNTDFTFNSTAKVVGIVKYDDMNTKDGSIIVSDNIAKSVIEYARLGTYSFAIGSMPSGERDVRKIVDFSVKDNDGLRFILKNSVTEEVSLFEGILSFVGGVFIAIGIAFAIFASLMLTNFIGTSISYKKHDIGMLRAIGSRSNDVFRIFFAESFIIAMINFVLAAITTGAISLIVNIFTRISGVLITIMNFGIRQVFLLFVISLLVAFLATFFPVRKIAKKRPIDAIKNTR